MFIYFYDLLLYNALILNNVYCKHKTDFIPFTIALQCF